VLGRLSRPCRPSRRVVRADPYHRSCRATLAIASRGRAVAGIIFARDEAATVQRDNVEIFVIFAGLVCAAHIRRDSIATSESEANPIATAGDLRRVFQRLENRTVVANNFGFVADTVLAPDFRDRQLAARSLGALLAFRSRLTGLAFRAALAAWGVELGLIDETDILLQKCCG
jgi:hypothetical protein